MYEYLLQIVCVEWSLKFALLEGLHGFYCGLWTYITPDDASNRYSMVARGLAVLVLT